MINLIKDRIGTNNLIEDQRNNRATNSDNNNNNDNQKNVITTSTSDDNLDETNIISKRLWVYLLQKTNIDPMLKWKEISSNDLVRIAEQVRKGLYIVEGNGARLLYISIYINKILIYLI